MKDKIIDYINKDYYRFFAIVVSFVGLIILTVFIFIVSRNHPLAFNNMNLENTASVGDFVGGFVGTLWSFAGILLFYSALVTQQEEFKLQQKELVNQKQEFASSRITTIIYRQLELLSEKSGRLEYSPVNIQLPIYEGGEVVFQNITYSHLGSKLVSENTGAEYDFSENISFATSRNTKEHLRYLAITLEVCIELIEQVQENSQGVSKSILNPNQKANLYKLLEGNLRSKELYNYLATIKDIYEMDIERQEFSLSRQQDVSDITKIMENLIKVSKKLQNTNINDYGLIT